jgi:hypothetical protein
MLGHKTREAPIWNQVVQGKVARVPHRSFELQCMANFGLVRVRHCDLECVKMAVRSSVHKVNQLMKRIDRMESNHCHLLGGDNDTISGPNRRATSKFNESVRAAGGASHANPIAVREKEKADPP